MRKLQLPVNAVKNGIESPYKYSVYLHDRKILYFKSRRKAQDFVRNFNTYVSDTIRLCYDIHVFLYSTYLNNSFTIKPYESNQIKRKLDGFLDLIEKWSRDYGDGWQSMKLNGFFNILNHIEDSALEMNNYFKKQKDYFHVNRINSYLQMIYIFYEKYDEIFKDVVTDLSYKNKPVKHLKPLKDIS
ncbi:hypothetical protein [uncultured Tenacibaculum sp.]|uniref:hypothetical protein n=1 Tax=uncultured Tenacibaculum sp. TaxID=174713 RepID=UPI00260E6FC5|nr:hypothetical protein [uncultured Tenacibaculum sp.]